MTETLPTRADLAEILAALVVGAKRCQYVHRRFELSDPPTAWDEKHAEIDDVLDEMVGH